MPNKLLSVKYFQQNDNDAWQGIPGNVQCCPTSNAMLAAYLVPEMVTKSRQNGFSEPESYYKSKFTSLGYSADNRGNHDAHTKVLEQAFGIKSEWRYDLTSKDIVRSIDVGIPVVVGVQYRSSGHILIVTGYYSDEGGGLYINDPYGLRAGASDVYDYINPGYGDETGKNDRYSWPLLNNVLFEPAMPNQGGWGRWVVAINGKSTGL